MVIKVAVIIAFVLIDSSICALRLTLEVIPEPDVIGADLCEGQAPYTATLGRVSLYITHTSIIPLASSQCF